MCCAVSRVGRRLVRDATGRRPGGELLGQLAGKLTQVPAGQVPSLVWRLAAAAEGYTRGSSGLFERVADVAYDRLSRRDCEPVRRALVPLRFPGASRRAERVRPSPESGPAPATCLLR